MPEPSPPAQDHPSTSPNDIIQYYGQSAHLQCSMMLARQASRSDGLFGRLSLLGLARARLLQPCQIRHRSTAPQFLLDDYLPRYQLLTPIQEAKKRTEAYAHLRNCNLCPRLCGVNRFEKRGTCLIGADVVVNTIAPHFGEEPCVQGKHKRYLWRTGFCGQHTSEKKSGRACPGPGRSAILAFDHRQDMGRAFVIEMHQVQFRAWD